MLLSCDGADGGVLFSVYCHCINVDLGRLKFVKQKVPRDRIDQMKKTATKLKHFRWDTLYDGQFRLTTHMFTADTHTHTHTPQNMHGEIREGSSTKIPNDLYAMFLVDLLKRLHAVLKIAFV